MSDDDQVFYSAFGLSLRSNLAIPGLAPTEIRSPKPDITMTLGSEPIDILAREGAAFEPYYVSKETDDSGEPGFRIWSVANGRILRMDYVDGVRFWFDRAGTAVWSTWPENLTISDAAVYLLGPVLGLLLRLRGVTCLHASAVAFGEFAIAFAGPPGAGKSTTAAALAKRGHALLSDDIVAIDERDQRFFAFPAHPYLGLWPESVEMIYGKEKKIPGFSATWEKGRLSLAEHDLRFQDRALPLGAVFLLGLRINEPSAPYLEHSPAQGNLMDLVANSYGTNLLETEMRGREFGVLGRLISTVPLLRVRPHADRAKLAALCDLIETSYGRLNAVP
jgi:hypothetical protein